MTKRYALEEKLAKKAAQEPEIEEDANQIADDMVLKIEEWLKPEIAKLIGEEAAEKIKFQDFDSVFALQNKLVFMERSHTVRKKGATFYFKLYQGIKPKHVLLSKFEYEVTFEEATPEEPTYGPYEDTTK
jgi:hypothetical protein